MYTSCPSCHTVFRIHADQLGLANGLVRCGVCDQSFLALGHLYERLDDIPRVTPPADVVPEAEPDGGLAAASASAAPPSSPIETAAEFPQQEPVTLEVQPPAQTTATETTRVSAAEAEPVHETSAVVEGLGEPTMSAGLGLEEVAEEPPLHLFADDMPAVLKADLQAEANRRRPAVIVLGALVALLLLAGLGVQYVLYQRVALAHNPVLRPYLTDFCSVFGCNLPLPHDPQQIELLARNVHSDPDVNDALLITATFVNHATFRQAYPLLEMRFSNLSGTLIAARYFRPVEYLPANADPSSGMPAGATVHVALAVSDPGDNAVSYELNFR